MHYKKCSIKCDIKIVLYSPTTGIDYSLTTVNVTLSSIVSRPGVSILQKIKIKIWIIPQHYASSVKSFPKSFPNFKVKVWFYHVNSWQKSVFDIIKTSWMILAMLVVCARGYLRNANYPYPLILLHMCKKSTWAFFPKIQTFPSTHGEESSFLPQHTKPFFPGMYM